jgi:alpha-1,2-mannosyltransferase
MTRATDTAPAWRTRYDSGLIVALVGLICLIFYIASYLAHAHPPRDAYGYVLGRDFVNTWMGARAVLSGTAHEILNVDVHIQRMVAVLGPMPPHNWSYPPALFLFIWPLGFFSYTAALAVWSATGFAAYLGAAATHDRSLRFLLFVAAAPAIAVNLFSGQTGFFTAAILILFFHFLDKRPVLAGALLGLMLCKPHLALLFPLALAFSGRWRTFLAAGAAALVLVAVTALIFGADIWTDYFRLVVPVQRGVLDTGTGFLTMMPTGFMHARMLGASLAVAWKVQTVIAVVAVAVVVWTFIKRCDPLVSAAVLLTASVIATPYSFNYDMVVFGWLMAMLWPRLTGIWDRLLLLVVWTLPVTMVVFGDLSLPVAAPILAIFLIRLVVLAQNVPRLSPPAAQLP